jgi:hypothetical protein
MMICPVFLSKRNKQYTLLLAIFIWNCSAPGCGALNLQPPDALPDDPASACRRLHAVNLIYKKKDAELNYTLLIKM